MPKKITPGTTIYVAHQMLGRYDNGPVVIDEENGSQLDPMLLDSKILIYQRQVKGWFLIPAKRMLRDMGDQASFAILGICFAYLEGNQQYREGRGSRHNSKTFFVDSFRRVFGSCGLCEDSIDMIYNDGRNGLFHDGMTRSRLIYDLSLDQAFAVQNNGSQDLVHFHPSHLLDCVELDFETYIKQLGLVSNEEERRRFDKMFNVA